MMTRSAGVRTTLTITAAALLLSLAAAPARAQGFFVPYLGTNFGGDSECAELSGCAQKTLNFGVALGSHSGAAGFEADFGYARGFFGQTPEGNSSVALFMSNLVIGPAAGPVQPYVAGGIGLIKTHVDFNVSSLVSTSDNNLGWDVGGGLVIGTSHVGIRGDLRRFKTFGDLSLGPVPVSGAPLKFWRATAGLFLGF
jgi:opacity protein-like surface antigen